MQMRLRLLILVPTVCCVTVMGATHYVDWHSTNATPSFTNWTTAAQNIQDAVGTAAAGEMVVVTKLIEGNCPNHRQVILTRVALRTSGHKNQCPISFPAHEL